MGRDKDKEKHGSTSKASSSKSSGSRSKSGRKRSRSRSPKRKKSRSRSPPIRKSGFRGKSPIRKKDKKAEAALDIAALVGMDDKDAQVVKLEEEMVKRRERIQSWQKERKIAALIAEEKKEEEEAGGAQQWSLEDDEEPEDAPAPPEEEPSTEEVAAEGPVHEAPVEEVEKAEEEEDEVDPLDAFMEGVNAEVRKTLKRPTTTKTAVTKIVTVTKAPKAGPSKEKAKGDVLEQNADALEYSDEEQEPSLESTISLATKARQLPVTDHSRVYYRPFRRDFYVEVPDLARLSPEEVDALREELGSIKVRGKRCPKPIRAWAHAGCSRSVLDVLKKSGFEKPTSIQCQAIPAIMSGRDVIGIAKTGSGKTLAFLLPLFRHIMDQEELEEMDGPIAMVLSPTRELALQTAKEARKFAKVLNVGVAVVYGGAGISEQIAELKRGVEVVVCTPGRMIDMLAANNGKVTNLRRVTYLVLDEADRMFDMGFEPQVMRILDNVRPDRQTVLFSATFPLKMEALARKILAKPIEIQVGGKSIVCADVEQRVEILEPEEKFLRLLQLLGEYAEMGNALVFVERQEKADDLVGELMKAGYNCAPLHGGIDQYDRESTIVDFKAARINLLVATSVAARGLDVKKLVLVINFDCPNHYEDYVHRVGRTGRAGNKGWAYTFINSSGQERMGGEVLKAMIMSNATPPPALAKHWEDFVARMKEEGKEIRMGGGFGGSGYKFDEDEEEEEAGKKNMNRIILGVQGGANEDDEDLDQTINKLIKSKRRERPKAGALSNKDPADKTGLNEDALEKAKKVAMAIQVGKNIGPGAKDSSQTTAEAVMKGEKDSVGRVTGKSIAHQLGALLNAKLDYQAEEKKEEETTELEEVVEEELEINDFPQQVRWRVCSRETMTMLQEYCDVFVSVRGVHVPGNKNPPAGEKKLHLYIESKGEVGLNRAKQEIIRVLREELKRLAQQGNRNQPAGRYKVL